MPQAKAAFKDIKQSNKRYERNQRAINEIKTLAKRFNELVVSKDAEAAKKLLAQLVQKIDKAKSKGILHKKTASRKVSRLSRKAARL